jgi:shikimate kinase
VTAARRVLLIGPRGSGKSTVAGLLAERLGWTAIDADGVLEQRADMTIRAIFAAEGQAGFRAREQKVLEELCRLERAVIATGGGAVLHSDNRERMRRCGVVAWLTADAQTLWQRMTADDSTAQRRPALAGGGIEEVVQILAEREPLYHECAHVRVETAGRSPEEVVSEVLRFLDRHQAER